MKKRAYRSMLRIPLYDARVWVVIGADLKAERDRLTGILGESDLENFHALCVHTTCGRFGIFLPRGVDRSTIAHEVFHLTHRIMEWANCSFDSGHHEQGALLCGYLSELIDGEIARDKRKAKA